MPNDTVSGKYFWFYGSMGLVRLLGIFTAENAKRRGGYPLKYYGKNGAKIFTVQDGE